MFAISQKVTIHRLLVKVNLIVRNECCTTQGSSSFKEAILDKMVRAKTSTLASTVVCTEPLTMLANE